VNERLRHHLQLHAASAVAATLALTLGILARAQDVEPPAEDEAVVDDVQLIDRTPFDRVTLNAANGNAVIETVLLDLPEHKVPDPLPTSGSFQLRQISQPSVAYAVEWQDVAKIELYEQLLMEEALRLTSADEFAEAFDYLAFLQTNYPDLAGLETAMQDFLWRDASTTFAAGDGDGAWPALVALYERNPEYPRLVNAVAAVSDGLISSRLSEKNYAGARAVLELVVEHFPNLELSNIDGWRARFEADARAQLAAAREAMDAGDFDAAREAAMFAHAILPDLEDARTMIREIQAAAPEIRVGVTEAARRPRPTRTPTWAEARGAGLLDPLLVEMVDFGAEGGEYASRFGELGAAESGLETSLRLAPGGMRMGITPDAVARQLLDAAGGKGADRHETLAGLFENLTIADGCEVQLTWRRPHLHPESLLQVPLRALTDSARAPGLWLDPLERGAEASDARYQRTGPPEAAAGSPRIVLEHVFDDDEAALTALMRGEIDAVDRVPPWQVDRMQRAGDVVVAQYRLPTIHVLIPNPQSPLLAMREFRRALCYGIDRDGIVLDILLGGTPQAGFRTVSGPFLVGVELNDPAGYATNPDVPPRPYEPRLAALLANVARSTLAKREAEQRKADAEAAKTDELEAAEESGEESESSDGEAEGDDEPPEPESLILAHPADPVARVCCQSIKLQLDRIGIPIKLVEIPASSTENVPYDLLYAELAIGEPVVDARRLLSATGVAGRASALMTAALEKLDHAQNLNAARERLREIHRIAHYDLPVIPLWQTVNHFASRTWLIGVGEQPVSLYQNLNDWRKEF
jgi:hypothetical protein